MADHTLEHELSRHAAALRSMARALVHPAEVDDLLQDTALAVLRTKPAQPGRLGALLITILRQLASKRRRSEARRRQREQAAAKPEATASAEQPLEQDEMVERLLRELLALPQPYREVLLQRFFEDRWPAQIAARMGVPVETVKTRIKRGLAMLRQRLDADGEGGEWRAALTATFGIGKAAAVAAGVVLMGTAMKLVLGGAAAATAVAAWLWVQAAPVAAPTQSIVQRGASSPAVADGDAAVSAALVPAADRREVATPSPAANTALATIRGRCIDEDGNPIAGITAHLTGARRQDRFSSNAASVDWRDPPEQHTGADGCFAFSFAQTPPFYFRLSVGSDDYRGGNDSWPELVPGQLVDLGDVPVYRTFTARFVVRDTDDAPVARADCALQLSDKQALHGPLELSVGGGGPTDPAGSLKQRFLITGSYQFLVYGREVVHGGRLDLSPEAAAMVHEITVATIDPADVIRGVVVDDAGTPLPRVRIEGAAGGTRQQLGTTAGKDGSFQLLRTSTMDRDPVQLWVTPRGYEALFPDERFTWGCTDVRLVVRRGATLEVLVVKADGAPVEDFRLWVLPRQDAFRGLGGGALDVRAKGNHPLGLVTIPGLARGPWFVLVEPSNEDLAMSRPQAITIDDQPARAVVRLRSAPHRLVRVQRRDGAAVPGSFLRLVDPAGTKTCLPGNAVSMPDWVYRTMNGAPPPQYAKIVRPVPIKLQEVVTDERGEATLRGIDDQALTVCVQGATHCPAQVDDVHLDVDEPLVITVASGATLNGTTQPEAVRALRELAGLPPTGQVNEFQSRTLPSLQLERGEVLEPETYPGPSRPVHFEGDGSFTFAHVPPGSWRLVLQTRQPNQLEHSEVVADVELRDGEATTVQLDLSPLLLGELSGRVLWNGQPLDSSNVTDEKVQLQVTATDLAGKSFDYWNLLETDADGRFTWRGRAGTVQFLKTWSLRAEEAIVVAAGGKVVRDFHGSSGSLRIRMVDDAGKPRAQLSVALLDPLGKPCPTLPPTGADGNSQRELAPGTYRVETLPERLLDPDAAARYLRAHPPNTDDAFAGARIHLGDVTVTAGHTTETTLHLPPEWSR